MKNRASCKELENQWKAFLMLKKAENDGVETTLSKRLVSIAYLERDPSSLSRWTNPKSPSKWLIPVSWIKRTCEALGGGQKEIDALMRARLADLEGEDKENDLIVVMKWMQRPKNMAKTDPRDVALNDLIQSLRNEKGQ
jgi:hypothetical protein